MNIKHVITYYINYDYKSSKSSMVKLSSKMKSFVSS